MYIVNCGRCGGCGFLYQHRGVLAGICFECKGKGTVQRKTKPVKRKKYRVYGKDKETGKVLLLFYRKARNLTEINQKMEKHFEKVKLYDFARVELEEWRNDL